MWERCIPFSSVFLFILVFLSQSVSILCFMGFLLSLQCCAAVLLLKRKNFFESVIHITNQGWDRIKLLKALHATLNTEFREVILHNVNSSNLIEYSPAKVHGILLIRNNLTSASFAGPWCCCVHKNKLNMSNTHMPPMLHILEIFVRAQPQRVSQILWKLPLAATSTRLAWWCIVENQSF